MLVLNKVVDQSVLKEGFTIPRSYQQELLKECGFVVPRGQKVPIQINIAGKLFDAVLTNILFDANKYPTHSDLLQIRYPANGALSQCLKDIFIHTHSKISAGKQAGKSVRVSAWENSEKEYIAIYSTPIQGQLFFDCISNGELLEEAKELQKFDEIITEQIFDAEDPNADIQLTTKLCKVRKMNRAIGNELKRLYGYRCQICGQYIGEKYGSCLIHAHHIDYFTRSLNNDASNILIVCPNHHGIIHDKNPVFDFKERIFHYPNGYHEGLVLNKHI